VVRKGSRCSTLSQSGVAEDLAAALQSDFVNSRRKQPPKAFENN
jgi:hypothetical protein